MPSRPLKNPAGFTYIAVLVLVMIMGIMLGVTGQTWKMIDDREREAELMFRGSQYREAIARWYKPKPDQPVVNPQLPVPPLRELKALLLDPNSLTKTRYLRRLYLDPLTGKEWIPINGPEGIIGVSSTSEAQPIKQGNFPTEYAAFEGKTKYSDWQFVYKKTTPVP